VRLTELNPRWWNTGGDRSGMGVSFDCPHCRTTRIGVAFANPIDGGAPSHLRAIEVMPVVASAVPPGIAWQRTGETFETLTLSPSVDTSNSGHWHGWVRAGEVTTC
jgi:hypothetical protein